MKLLEDMLLALYLTLELVVLPFEIVYIKVLIAVKKALFSTRWFFLDTMFLSALCNKYKEANPGTPLVDMEDAIYAECAEVDPENFWVLRRKKKARSGISRLTQ